LFSRDELKALLCFIIVETCKGEGGGGGLIVGMTLSGA
jgi:hypothetical protein